jgi:hypothetical protein
MTVFTLFETNAWNSEPILVGVFSTKEKAIQSAIADSKNRLSKDDLNGLKSDDQTQGREINYDIQKVELDK